MNKILISLLAAGGIAGAGYYAAAQSEGVPVAAMTAAIAPAAARAGSGADAKHPVVLELFQSQGCSSCPPANRMLDALANRPEVLALNFSVTYWDQLGWKDTYGQPKFTARQWDYAHAQGRGNVQTPQLIVNGKGAVLGSFQPEIDQAIAKYARGPGGPEIAATGGRVTIGTGRASRAATVWLVDYDARSLQIPIRAGENGGRTLPHRDLVTALTPLGNWTGASASFATPAAKSGNARAILVQDGTGGAIVAAAKI